ncbi:MAG: PD-(D/E)XK nuclease family protein [Omnitrophica bacterium]|nr:PD-(D/E)XK nuclease family protein [Candidatus Omnitrophota bacterium]
MKKLKRELSWSFSRDRLFKECRREYYYYYYASWEGWEKKADEFTRRAYILKNVRNIDAWIGDIVHQIIKWIIESKLSGKDVALEAAIKRAKGLLMKTWEQSRTKMWVANPKYNLNLFEHYYRREPAREKLSLKLQKVTKSIRNIYDTGLFQLLIDLPANNILRIDELDSFDFEGIKTFAIPDFALGNDGCTLYDWKTGKRSDRDVLQLSCYVLYAIYKWGVPHDRIKIVPVYLTEEVVSLNSVEVISIDDVRNYIRKSIKDMKEILLDVDANNIDFEHCSKTNNTWRCKNCKFQEICK